MQLLGLSLRKFLDYLNKHNPRQEKINMNHKLIIGLGNPGPEYQWTRHNLGWLSLTELMKSLPDSNWNNNKQSNSLVAKANIGGESVVLMKPLTFMNQSGRSIREYLDYFKGTTEQIIVVYDDVDLELGRMKISNQGGSAGHNGVKSIIKELKTDNFLRIRLGVKNKKLAKIPTDKFVLQPFGLFEKQKVKKWLPNIAEAIECLVIEDLETCKKMFHS